MIFLNLKIVKIIWVKKIMGQGLNSIFLEFSNIVVKTFNDRKSFAH